MGEIFLSALYGAVGGALTAGSFYFKNLKKNEKFDLVKFSVSVVTATLAGVLASFGMDANIVTTGAVAATIGMIVENSIKFFRK